MKNRIDFFVKMVYEISYVLTFQFKLGHMKFKQQANLLLYQFENTKFLNEGRYDYRINLIFEFDDYIRNLPDSVLAELLSPDENGDAAAFRKMIDAGINEWLDSCLVKTMTLC